MAAPQPSSDLGAAKKAARLVAASRRAGCDPALGEALTRHALAGLAIPPGAPVSGYWPIRDEIDIRPLLKALHARGHKVLLPETPPMGRPLIFRHWLPGSELVSGRFGTVHPDGPEGVPQVLFVPLLAFDRAGRRLGYGGGYYDRSLAALPGALAVGCGYAAQELDVVPADSHDARLQAVVTETGVIRFPDESRDN